MPSDPKLYIGIAHFKLREPRDQNQILFKFIIGTKKQLIERRNGLYRQSRLHICRLPERFEGAITALNLHIPPEMIAYPERVDGAQLQEGSIFWKQVKNGEDKRRKNLSQSAVLFESVGYNPLFGLCENEAKALRDFGLKGFGSYLDGAASLVLKRAYGATHVSNSRQAGYARILQYRKRKLTLDQPIEITEYSKVMLGNERLRLREVKFENVRQPLPARHQQQPQRLP